MVSRACRPCPLPFVRGSRISYMIPFQELHREGIGVEIKHAPITSGDEEIILWEWQILGCHLPTALNEGYFFLNGNHFCLRSGKEYRISRFHNFRERYDHRKYTKHGSRNFCGGLADLRRQENKVVQQFVCPTAGDHCHVRLLDLYVSKLGQREGCLLLHSTA